MLVPIKTCLGLEVAPMAFTDKVKVILFRKADSFRYDREYRMYPGMRK